jgi:hypothetical protein
LISAAGVGLAVTKEIIHLHDGVCGCTSTQAVKGSNDKSGSSFYISLPVANNPNADKPVFFEDLSATGIVPGNLRDVLLSQAVSSSALPSVVATSVVQPKPAESAETVSYTAGEVLALAPPSTDGVKRALIVDGKKVSNDKYQQLI